MSEQAPFSEEVLVNRVMCKQVRKLDLSARVINYLENDGIVYVGDLVQKTEDEILRLPNFGRTTLNAIKETLARLGLRLGMDAPGQGCVTDRSE